MDWRLRPEKRLQTRQTHHDGFDERDVAEGLQGADQDSQELLDVVVCDGLGNAAENDQAARLQRRIVAESEALGQRGPLLQPVALRNARRAREELLMRITECGGFMYEDVENVQCDSIRTSSP